MTSATDELLKLLEERGLSYQTNYLHTSWRVESKLYDAVDNFDGTLTVDNLTPEQAIAATMENNPYDAVSCEHVISSDTLHLILDEWDVHPGWTATNENMAQLFGHTAATLGSGFNPDGLPAGLTISDDNNLLNWRGENYVRQSALGGGECEWELEHSGTLYDKWRCSECKFLFVEPRCDQGYTDLVPNFCPRCGKAVKR